MKDLDIIFKALKEAVLKVPGTAETRCVLYGSRARGDYDEWSDIDIAVIVPGLTSPLKHAVLDVIADVELEHDVVLSTLVISLGEFERLKQRERRIALDIDNEGVVL